MSRRGPCSKKPPPKATPRRWIGSAISSSPAAADRRDTKAAKGYYEQAAALGDEDAKAALKRLECAFTVKDKRGNVIGNLCY